MAVSKVILNGQTLIDVTEDTVASNNLLQGNQATGADGVTVSGGVTKKAAQTYTPGTTDQIIASGQYLNGAQTIKGDANLIPANIASGASIFGVQGTHEGGGSSVTVDPLNVTVNGTYTAAIGHAYSPITVNVPSSSTSRKQITFYDYDGKIVESYTASEFAELQTLPSNPSHSRLVAQGWNWTLAQIQDYLSDCPESDVNVGQMYITASGATEIDVELTEDTLEPWLLVGVDGSAEIDWGDGTTHDTITGTSATTMIGTQHAYSTSGSYTISIIVNSGSIGFQYTNIVSSLLCDRNLASAYTRKYLNNIKNVYFGINVTSIGSYAFSNCYSLALVTIPSSVTSIGNYAFSSCYSLASLTIPSSMTSIGGNVFSSCYGLVSVTIPSSVTSIETGAFNSCYSLTSVTIPSSVTSIGTSAFNSCYSLTSVTIPSSVTSMGTYAFQNCRNLTSLIILSNVTSIGSYAFSNCYSLALVTIPSSVTSIGNYAFSTCFSLSSLTIPSSVTSIGTSAFQNCHSLASVTIPSSMTSIGGSAFNSCDGLASLTIPSSVTSIGSYAIASCYSLASLTIPSSVTSIASYAFQNCYSMLEYHFQSTTPPTLSNANAFQGIDSNCIIYVPKGSLAAYQTAANWSTYASYMQEEPD